MQAIGEPKVSVVIPTHNRARTIVRAVQSVLDQTFDNIEVIVVDDASSDDTCARVNAIEDSRIRLVRHANNRGACAARNSGIEAASAPFIAFQDSDDEWVSDKLQSQMLLFEQSGAQPLVAYCGFIRISGEQSVRVPAARDRHRSGAMIPTLLHHNLVSTQTLVAPRTCLLSIGGFTPDLPRLQDWDLAIRLAQRYRFAIVDRPLVTVHTTPDSITKDAPAFLTACRMLLIRHSGLFAQYPDAELRMRLRIIGAAFSLGLHDIVTQETARIARMGLPVMPAIAKLTGSVVRDLAR